MQTKSKHPWGVLFTHIDYKKTAKIDTTPLPPYSITSRHKKQDKFSTKYVKFY